MASSNRLLNFKNINREKYEYLDPEKSENGSYVSSCVYNLDGENKLGYYFECPRVVSPSGIYKSGGKYMMDVVIPLGSSLLEFLLSEDEMNMKATSMNSDDWFGEHFPLEVVQEKYNSALVFQNGNPILKLCIPTYQGKPMCEVFDTNRNMITYNNVKPGSEVALILEKVGLRFLKEIFVGEYTAHKIKLLNNQQSSQLPSGYLFGEQNEEEEGSGGEEEEGSGGEEEEGSGGEEEEGSGGEEEEGSGGEEEEGSGGEEEEGSGGEEEEGSGGEEELLSGDESEFGDQLTDEELELEFSEDESQSSGNEEEEETQDFMNIENELDELNGLGDSNKYLEGGEEEELESESELEFNPAELTDEELELSDESEEETNNQELTDDELGLELDEYNLLSPVTNMENNLELDQELDIDLEEQDLKAQIRDDVSQKFSSMNIDELRDDELELEFS
jgi:hypothetical protein